MIVSAWCRACQHTVLLDLQALVAGGHGDVPLIHLPLRCRSRDNYVDIANAGRIRACHQLSQTMLATSRTAARKFRAVFSYRVAMARNCLILAKKFSIRWRAA